MKEKSNSFGESASARQPEQRGGDMLAAYDGLRSELTLLLSEQRTLLIEKNVDPNAIYEGQRRLSNLMHELWRVELQISTRRQS
jgi:hypothetical protein